MPRYEASKYLQLPNKATGWIVSLASITLLFQGKIILPASPSLSYSLPAAATASGKEGKKVVALKDFRFTRPACCRLNNLATHVTIFVD